MPKNNFISAKFIFAKIKKNKKEPDLYNKVNFILQGAPIGTKALVREIASVIRQETDAVLSQLKEMEKSL